MSPQSPWSDCRTLGAGSFAHDEGQLELKRILPRRNPRLGLLLLLLGPILLLAALWTWWAESHPHHERQLRVLVQEQLEQWFPEEMRADAGQYGLVPRLQDPTATEQPLVLLVHGLDEPGSIWDELVPALGATGVQVWEFRYPNDQAIDRSTDLLAEHWPELATRQPVVLIGHSMGGLVIRDFVSRWRHPVGGPPGVAGPSVGGVILAGTPNQGSEWARLRIWLELRDHFAGDPQRRFSLFAGLRDGTGAAKIDLRPGSHFLDDLNARPWPDAVPIRIIGGTLLEPQPAMAEAIAAIHAELGSDELAIALESWWSDIGEGLGDGVVPVASLAIPGAPAPILVPASHRGMLVRLFPNDSEPPAIRCIVRVLAEWLERSDKHQGP
jgi:pimeloyl-ACP methyl ester carboxylesterase